MILSWHERRWILYHSNTTQCQRYVQSAAIGVDHAISSSTAIMSSLTVLCKQAHATAMRAAGLRARRFRQAVIADAG